MRIFRSAKGFSLIEVMMAAGSLGIVSLGVLAVNSMGLKATSNNNITYSADSFRKKLANAINNDQAWANTVNDPANTSLACIKNTTDCTGASGKFRIRDASNNIIYDPLSSPNNGFNASGALCTTFNPAAGAGVDTCPFRADFTWTAVCPASAPCLNPQVTVSGTTTYNPNKNNKFRNLPFNAQSYGLNMVRNATATAQGNGAGYYLAKWATNKTLTNSAVFESDAAGNFLGIGNANPQAKLDLAGTAGQTFRMADGTQGTNFLFQGDASGFGRWVDPMGVAVGYLNDDAANAKFHWSGQGGQPSWVWGGNDPSNMYVWNPSNFSVAQANVAMYVNNDSYNSKFHFTDPGGQPSWLWGTNDGANEYVFDRNRIKVGFAGYADNAGYATNAANAGWASNSGYSTNCGTCTSLAGGGGAPIQIKVWNTAANYATIGYEGSDANFGLWVDGQYIKHFTIQHPLDNDRFLVHGTLEGPEGGVYYRGTAELENGYARVKLPRYFEALTRKEDRTVQLTNVGGFDPLTVREADGVTIHDGYFEVVSNVKSSHQKFHWQVNAVRGDVDQFDAEPLKSEVDVHGFGPYTYLSKKSKHVKTRLEQTMQQKDDEIQALKATVCEMRPSAPICQ